MPEDYNEDDDEEEEEELGSLGAWVDVNSIENLNGIEQHCKAAALHSDSNGFGGGVGANGKDRSGEAKILSRA